MNDPWDVKSVRQSGQYVSCMKINGVPLLPPVLSKECRKEMQYYKLLAKEVEKRIAQLQPYYIDSDTESSDKTDAPDLPDSEQNDEPEEDIEAKLNININNITNVINKVDDIHSPVNKLVYKTQYENKSTERETLDTTIINSSKFVIDLSVNINDNNKNNNNINKNAKVTTPIDIPERDYDSPKKQNELLTEFESVKKHKVNNIVNIPSFIPNKEFSDPFIDLPLHQDGPSSISSKSFTGSLIDIHTDSMKNCQKQPLTRQRSYTLLKPSPQLLAHLEEQSQSTGVDMNCISMSESLSNLTSPSKKRRSWDLESAKAKWSSMAMELKQQKMPNAISKNACRNQNITPVNKKQLTTQARARSVIADKTKRVNACKGMPKSDPIQQANRAVSPVRNAHSSRASLKSASPKNVNNKEQPENHTTLISESEDPATRVRELYERIQKQQLLQMASLVEKQKREQMLLQQVFEEQNNLLYTQLKTICPKSPVDTKEAWVDKCQEVERGPVSLSQLINNRVDQSDCDTSISTLTDTNNYINHCDSVLKKSRDITGSLKKQTNKSNSMNGSKIETRPQSNQDGSKTRTHSPVRKNPTSRRLNYDSSATSDPEYEPILTDRTNDTMANLNVTFPSDSSDGSYHSVLLNLSNDIAVKKTSPIQLAAPSRSTDRAISNMEKSIQNSINTLRSQVVQAQPSPRERAAATKIVAYAKGYLVRRLMRTERVRATVQTIKDALLCALQLHQDREGIHGADVDLHRRLIQQITAACYSLHDTFVASTPAERCAMIAADRGRRRSIAAKPPQKQYRQTDIMSQSYHGSLAARSKRPTSASLMTQSNYETFSSDKSGPMSRARYLPSPRRRPWR